MGTQVHLKKNRDMRNKKIDRSKKVDDMDITFGEMASNIYQRMRSKVHRSEKKYTRKRKHKGNDYSSDKF